MAKETVGYVKLEWTCPNCGSRNPGPQKTCTNCGSPQPDNVTFEQAPDAQIISDEESIKKAEAGPDIHCPYCGARNEAGKEICVQCGGDLKEGLKRASGQVLGAYQSGPVKEIPCPQCGAPNPETNLKCNKCSAPLTRAPQPPTPPPAAPAAPQKMNPILIVLLVLVGLCICGVLIFFISQMSKRESISATVKEVSWLRSVIVEKYGPVNKSGWKSEMPSEATVKTCEKKLHHTQDEPAAGAEKVCGTPYTVDKGSGYGKVVQDCQYKVYADYCSYTVKEWQKGDDVTLKGTDFNPQWPTPKLAQDTRLGDKKESYTCVFSGNGKTYSYSTDEATFRTCKINSKWNLEVNGFGDVVSITPAK